MNTYKAIESCMCISPQTYSTHGHPDKIKCVHTHTHTHLTRSWAFNNYLLMDNSFKISFPPGQASTPLQACAFSPEILGSPSFSRSRGNSKGT